MEHKGTVRIETERLVLRRFAADDGPAVFRNSAGRPMTMRALHRRFSANGLPPIRTHRFISGLSSSRSWGSRLERSVLWE